MVYNVNQFIPLSYIRYMKNSTNEMTAEQSLGIITSMIQEAKGNIRQNSFYFLLWGWVVVLAHAGMYLLPLFEIGKPYYVWFVTIPAWLITFLRIYREGRTDVPATHLEKVMGIAWITFGVTMALLIPFGAKFNFQFNALILLFTAVPTLLSGFAMRFKPLIIGGILFWAGGVICFLVSAHESSLVAACTVAAGYLVPGYLLRSQQDNV